MFWDQSGTPQNTNDTIPATFKVKGVKFTEPVWVDVLTGDIYEIPAAQVSVEGDTTVFIDLPVYDAPVFVTDKSLLTFEEPQRLIWERQQEASSR